MKYTATIKTSALAASVEATFVKCLDIVRKKNGDYATAANEWKNFETCTRIGVSVQAGIFTRLLDKITRLENLFTGDGRYVTEETFDDTIEDAINYLALLKARRYVDAPPAF